MVSKSESRKEADKKTAHGSNKRSHEEKSAASRKGVETQKKRVQGN